LSWSTHDDPSLPAAEFQWHGLGEIKQAVIDIEKMFSVLSRNPEIKDVPGAKPLIVTTGNVRFRRCAIFVHPERQSEGSQFEVPAGKTVAIVGPSGAGQIDHFALLFRL